MQQQMNMAAFAPQMRELTNEEIEAVSGGITISDATSFGSGLGAVIGSVAVNTARGAANGGAVGAALGFSFGVGYAIGGRIRLYFTE